MPKKLQYFIIHCTATPDGRSVTPDEIRQWHLGPYALTKEDIANELKKTTDPKIVSLLKSNAVLRYNGSFYRNAEELPDKYIGGASIKKLRGRGWSQVGYSDMILLDGTLVSLVPYDNDQEVEQWEITNGATGINSIARHIVYVGGMDKAGKVSKDTRTPQQRATLEAWVRTTIKYNPQIKGAGHNQFAKKDCPSFFVPIWLKSIGIADLNIHAQ